MDVTETDGCDRCDRPVERKQVRIGAVCFVQLRGSDPAQVTLGNLNYADVRPETAHQVRADHHIRQEPQDALRVRRQLDNIRYTS